MELQPDGQLEQLIDNSNQHTPYMWRFVCARMSCHFNQKRHNGNMQRIIWQLNNTLNLNLTQTQSEESWAQVMSQRGRQWLLNEKRFVSTVSLSIHSCIHRTIKCAVRTWLRPSLLRSYKHDSALSISAHFSVCFFSKRLRIYWTAANVIDVIISSSSSSSTSLSLLWSAVHPYPYPVSFISNKFLILRDSRSSLPLLRGRQTMAGEVAS